ncbi:heavy metal translocating P-type ATPase [Granulicatella seriolae]|uniref:Heavy metal translocating P-type ATPase n=1 Tax=Granulicatella seriolae TaxID=2967226 RepID=A0ABT1WPC5_9LACT|nr:heavy metal translocating P-type ATPase [Granulicatella seriolae]
MATQEHKHQHRKEKEHHHTHQHNHESKLPVILYGVGLATFIVGLVIHGSQPTLSTILFIFTTFSAGYHVMGEGFGDTIRNSVAAKRFVPNIHLLMMLAAVGAVAIGNSEEAALLILIFAGAHFLEEYAEGRSKKEITQLLKLNPSKARLIQADGSYKSVAVEELNIGDRLQVLTGDQIPTDGLITDGVTVIDESTINGESMPKEKVVGDQVYASTINQAGSFTMEVTKDSKDTVFAKILQLVEESQSSLSKTATRIQKIEPIYVTIVLAILPIHILLGPALFSWTWSESLYRGMVFLIAASPCALAASAVPASLSAISNLASKGVLFKGSATLANLQDIKAIAMDKTGTLTQGKPSLTDSYFGASGKLAPETIKEYLQVIQAMEAQSSHPLASAITSHLNQELAQEEGIQLPVESIENIIGVGLSADYQGHLYQVAKPSHFPEVDVDFSEEVARLGAQGKTVVLLARDGVVWGLMAFMDLPKPQSLDAVGYFKEQGVHAVMITGDAVATGQAIGKSLGMDQVLANVMPEDKAKHVRDLQEQYGQVAMVGDGVNDAPALVTADIGVAMGQGTDVAINVADVVLMQDDLSKLVAAHKVSKRMNHIVNQNMIFSMAVVVLLVVLNILGQMDIAIGVIAHEGSTLVVIANSLRLLLSRE